ncbi:MAG TPA: DUF1080 domain-containing protein, partial [Chthonomonadaceae bacterium]|nr:DUF1080 domain-containing protein [Chthonomonadaceae bacterium]
MNRRRLLQLETILLMLVALSAAAAPAVPQGQPQDETRRLVGAWDITVHTPRGDVPSWLGVERSGATTVGRFVGVVGSARPLSKIEIAQGVLRLDVPRQYESRDLHFEGRLDGDRITGEATGYAKEPCPWIAVRAPRLKREGKPAWGPPVALFNGRDLDGWRTQGGQNHWIVQDGLLVNAKDGANLVSTAKFEDFKLHAEFRYPKGSNSGIYLRGRYEVQVEDDEGDDVNVHTIGGIYGFFAPCVRAAKRPGEWQTLDVTLVGRVATVVLNG